MGFFKDFKDDLTQAVNELLPDDVFNDDNELLFSDDEILNTLEAEIPSDDGKSGSLSEQERADKIDANVEAFLQKVKALDENSDLDGDMGFKIDDMLASEDEMLFTDAIDNAMEETEEREDILATPESTDFVSENKDVPEDIQEEVDVVEEANETEEENIKDVVSEEASDIELPEQINDAEVDDIVSSIEKEEDKMITEIANEDNQMDDVVGLKEVKEERPVSGSEVTVIAKNTVINGSINSASSLEVYGTVEGDIDCGGKLSINGVVKGNSKAQEVFINAKRLEGNIVSTGNIKVGQGTVIVGDINASAGVIAGAIKGQIDVSGAIVLDSTAIVKGNIKAKSVQVNNGAVVDGYCSLIYADVDLDNVFDAE